MILRLTKIRNKLTALILLSSLVATSFAGGALTIYWITLRVAALGDDLETTATALGETCHATIAFNLPEEAKKQLLALKGKPTVVHARILAPESTLFAEYRRDPQSAEDAALPAGPYPLRRLGWNRMEVVTEIVRDGEKIGLFYLHDDLSSLWVDLGALLLVLPLVVIGSLGLTYAAIRRLQHRITDPILALAETAALVSRGKNYALRASKQSPDEIGDLTDAFNQMLEEIQTSSLSLRSSEQRYRTLLTTAPLPILVHCDGNLLYLNPAAALLLRQDSAEALVGRSFLAFIATADDRNQIMQPFAGDVPTGSRHHGAIRISLPANEFRDLEVTSIDIDYDGCRSHLLICVDITEKLVSERKLAEYRNQLEELVAERTAALRQAQEQLLLKERLAVLGQLTATVSHELRNPLGTIGNALSNLQMAMDANRADLVEKSLQVADRNVERCDRIINELLDYSRKGKLTEQLIAVDPWLQELLDELSWPVQIRLETAFHSDARILGDSDRLRRAVLNLIVNAQQSLQGIERAGKIIRIETGCRDGRLEIIVEDNGPGVPEELRSKIFEPLFSTKPFGVGLGMSVVEEVMRSHRGGVEIQTPEGGGCRFVLWLPVEGSFGGDYGY